MVEESANRVYNGDEKILQKMRIKMKKADNVDYEKQLQKMIQCKTVSVKDNYDDTEFAKLRLVMEELFPGVHKHAKKMTFSDDCWMYCIEGKDKTRNIMLMSHHDVVDAEGEWKYDGFSGEIAEGKVWGRGTVDTKTPLFAEFTALEELLKEGYEPPCNIYIGSSHNEEIAGDGVPKALEYFKEQGITFEVILDEGGAVIDPPVGGMKVEKCAMVAVHEKGFYHLNCKATAGSGHAGLTAGQKATPVERMSAFIHEVSSKNIFIRRLNPQITAMFTHMAPHCKFPMNLLFGNLWLFGGILKKVMPSLSAAAGGLLGTTCVFNEIKGTREEKCCMAKATLRPVDASDWQKDLQAFIEVAKKYDITVEVDETSEYHEPADMSKPQLGYTFDCIKQVFPAYPPIPMILPAGTDARHFTEICPCILRFAPIRLSAQQLASVHSENENIDVDVIGDAVAFYRLFLKEYR